MGVTRLFISLIAASCVLAACQNDEPAEDSSLTAEDATSRAYSPLEPGSFLEIASDLGSYQAIVRQEPISFCRWERKNGKLRPVFFREDAIKSVMDELNGRHDPTPEDLSVFRAMMDEVETCLRVQIPGGELPDTDTRAQLIEDKRYFRIESSNEAIAQNMFRLIERYGHTITFICPIENGVMIAYDDALRSPWADKPGSALDKHLAEIYPVETKIWDIEESDLSALDQCITQAR